jgi:hypothetical protein
MGLDTWADASEIAIASGSACAALATAFAATYGFKLWKSTDALAKQTETANKIAAEASWLDVHERLRPTFTALAKDLGNGQASLEIEFVGPDALERLDEMSISLRDDIPHREEEDIPGTTIQQRKTWLWSLWKFKPSHHDPNGGRHSDSETNVRLRETYAYDLVVTNDPRPGADHQKEWERLFDQAETRIEITSVLHTEGDQPDHMWKTPVTVEWNRQPRYRPVFNR